MARKQAAILDAARDAFLNDGYGRTSMEAIAAAAGVSIMTLYRHAEGKDDLFAAVIESACHPSDQAERGRIEETLHKSLPDVLVFVGLMFQERLASHETTTLFRVVMEESRRFPHLAEMAYRGLIATHQEALEVFLGQREETRGLQARQRRDLSAAFLSRLVGIDSFRILLGLEGLSERLRQTRAKEAAGELLSSMTKIQRT